MKIGIIGAGNIGGNLTRRLTAIGHRPRPAGDPDRMALPVAGDDEAAKRKVRDLMDELGFDTVVAGGLDDSWRQQPDTPVYGLRAGAEGVSQALEEASPERKPEFRA